MEYISGIYKIKNIVNNKIYIGSSNNIHKRKNEHFSALKNGTHCNSHLQRAYNFYGENNFIFEIIEACEEIDLLKVEQKYLDEYFDNGINCYNENPIANKPPSQKGKTPWNKGKNKIYSKKTLEKMSESKKNKKLSEEHKLKIRHTTQNKEYSTSKKILCIEKNIIFKSINEAERITNIKSNNISKCCNGKRKTAGGYHWQFV